MTAGKRRTAREMAVQMLYQSDLGGSALPHIFNTFDLAEYMARSAAAASRRAPVDPASPANPADPEHPADSPAPFAAIAAAIAAATAAADSAASSAANSAVKAGANPVASPAPPSFPPAVSVPAAAAPAAGTPAARPERNELARQKRRVDDAFQYAQTLVRGTVDHREEIDAMIRGQADNWRLERMPAVDRNILRLAIYEMLYERETPKLVVVDEAIELAKKFGSEQSGRFVNGLLDGLLKQHTFPGSLT